VTDSADRSDPGEAAADTGADDVDREAFLEAVEAVGRPVLTAGEAARRLGVTQAEAAATLDDLADADALGRVDVSSDPVVYYPAEYGDLADRERVIVFPERRQLVVDGAAQFTRARIATFAHLVTTARSEGALYEVRPEDVWNAPYDSIGALRAAVRSVVGSPVPTLEEWIEDQWHRAHRFRLYTHAEGYVVLAAESESLMGNVAMQELEEEIRAPIGDDEAWVAAGEVASLKRTLYEAGYPVEDDRDLDAGDPLDLDLRLDLRDYQAEWVERFLERGSGVFVGPPGSGKTVAALGAMAAVGGETLVLVPSRELAAQWREVLLADTTLTPEQVGTYHGGTKEVRPVTVATYQIAGMDRHRALFEERAWGLVVYDEVHHVPAPVFSLSADIQTKHRLGLTATPVRADDRETDIYTLVGPPIGTDWSALFEAGHVQQPAVEIRYLDWADDVDRHEYDAAGGHEARQLAASNPAKDAEVERLLAAHAGRTALVFVDYLDQGERLADRLGVPFVSGETPHARRRALLGDLDAGERSTLVVSRVGDEGIDLPDAEVAILASGLGGSRRQGAQRAGRTMRPAGDAQVYVLATRGTEEESFARQQTSHLAAKGVAVREIDATTEREAERTADGSSDTDADGQGDTDSVGSGGAAGADR
jgi:DNA excision repair protein ERCC-3